MAADAGLYGLTLEKMMIDTLGVSLEAETNQLALVTDSYTPDFNADEDFADVDNEVSGTGYTSGGVAVTSTEITVSNGVLTFDAADTVFSSVTVSNARAGILTAWSGTAATSELISSSDFGSGFSATAANFTVQWHASGIFTVDFIP